MFIEWCYLKMRPLYAYPFSRDATIRSREFPVPEFIWDPLLCRARINATSLAEKHIYKHGRFSGNSVFAVGLVL